MRACHANGYFSHTHAMTTHAMFAPYKSHVVSRGGLLLPLTYLPGTSVGKKITPPGLFKVEWCGNGFIGLCSKTYYCFGATDKYSTKGLSKRQNVINKDTFLAVLTNRRSGSGVNRGFRVRDSSVMTYIQEKAVLTYFYGKRKVLADGPSTAPLEL